MKVQTWKAIRNQRASATVLLAGWVACGFISQSTPGLDRQRSLRGLVHFRLSMEKLRKAAQAGKILEKLSETDSSLTNMSQFDRQKGALAIDETVARIDENPQARTVIESAGLSTRDYVLTLYCFERSTQALFLKQGVGEKHYPPGASERNVKFVRDHLKEINSLFSGRP